MDAAVKSLRNIAILLFSLFLVVGCRPDSDSPPDKVGLTVGLADLVLKHGKYYQAHSDTRVFEIVFSQPVRPETIPGNIALSDARGSIEGQYSLEVEGESVFLQLADDYRLHPGWKYRLSVNTMVDSMHSRRLARETVLEIRTASHELLLPVGNEIPAPEGRNSIVCISDIHMGDERAADKGYGWFIENAAALEVFTSMVRSNPGIRQLVILGDLFDEWLIPHATKPFDGEVTNSAQYFSSVRNAGLNRNIIDLFSEIITEGNIELHFVRGNHDMLLTEEMLQGLIPDIRFHGQRPGLGQYVPADGIVMEHGHRYDFFNSPQPMYNPPHILPPGYFVSRLWASGMEAEAAVGGPFPGPGDDMGPYGDTEITFPLAWDATLLYTVDHFFPELIPPLPDDQVIEMNGIDGYSSPFSFHEAKSMFVNGSIEANWPATQFANDVNVQSDVLTAILNGQSDLYLAAQTEYLANPGLFGEVKVVVFGHTHNPKLEYFPQQALHEGIYANTGSWVNQNVHGYIGGTPNKVRTFVVVSPSAWTGSELDVVTLYQFQPDPDGDGYTAIRIAEESLDAR